MRTVSEKTRANLEMQGYVGLDDESIAEFDLWLRLAPALCMTWTAIATATASWVWIALLVPVAVIGAFRDGHPFEIVYNHGIRHLKGTRHLPPAGEPRRFACGVASGHLAVTALAFYTGATGLGYLLGGMMVMGAAIPTFTGFCIPSWMYGKLFGASDEDVRLAA